MTSAPETSGMPDKMSNFLDKTPVGEMSATADKMSNAFDTPQPGDQDLFSWSNGSQVVDLQCPVAVYANRAGGVTIRQDQLGMMGEDVLIVLTSRKAVEAVIAALQRELAGL